MKTQRNRVSFQWEVDDGYCGGSAPQHTTVDISEIEECETVEEAVNLVKQAIEDDFRNHANPVYNRDKFRQQIEEIFNNRSKDE